MLGEILFLFLEMNDVFSALRCAEDERGVLGEELKALREKADENDE